MNSRPVTAVCIDFHNTIAICDCWFELEINELVPAFLRWLSPSTGITYDQQLQTDGRRLYRSLRTQVMESGVEVDAGESLRIILELLEIQVQPTCIEAGLEEIMKSALRDTRPVPGAIELITTLHSKGIPVIVVSSAAYHEFLEWTLDLFDISELLRAIISSARVGIYKSSPDIYTYAAATLGVEPENCVHIGDSHRFDVVTAKKAGMRTIWLNSGTTIEPDTADLTVKSLSDIPLSILNGFW